MNKSKILTVFAAAMLSSCVGFASEFKDDGADYASLAGAKTPMKPVIEKRSLKLAERDFTVTPKTERSISDRLATVELSSPQILQNATAELSGLNMLETRKAVLIAKKVKTLKDKRNAVLHSAIDTAAQKDAEISAKEDHYDSVMSAKKHNATLLTIVGKLVQEREELEGELRRKQGSVDTYEADLHELTLAIAEKESKLVEEAATADEYARDLLQMHEEQSVLEKTILAQKAELAELRNKAEKTNKKLDIAQKRHTTTIQLVKGVSTSLAATEDADESLVSSDVEDPKDLVGDGAKSTGTKKPGGFDLEDEA